jgi:hypothetical protein
MKLKDAQVGDRVLVWVNPHTNFDLRSGPTQVYYTQLMATVGAHSKTSTLSPATLLVWKPTETMVLNEFVLGSYTSFPFQSLGYTHGYWAPSDYYCSIVCITGSLVPSDNKIVSDEALSQMIDVRTLRPGGIPKGEVVVDVCIHPVAQEKPFDFDSYNGLKR